MDHQKYMHVCLMILKNIFGDFFGDPSFLVIFDVS